MDKPTLKKEVGILSFYEMTRYIFFNSSSETSAKFTPFGHIDKHGRNYYMLRVDSRYDFNEVLAYMESYGEEGG